MQPIQRLGALAPLFVILACTDPTSTTPTSSLRNPNPPTATKASINVGYGPDLFYYLRHDPAAFNFSTFGTISTSGTHTDRFGVGSNFDALTFTTVDVGYGTNLFYFVRHDPAAFNFSTFGTISTSGAITDRFGVGANFDGLTFAAADLGYGPNLFYYVRHNPAAANASTFGTISTSGTVTDLFVVGADFDAIVFVAGDLGYGPDLFYYLRHSGAGNSSTFGTISTTGTVTDRFGVGSNFDGLAFAAADVGYGSNLFYFLRHDPASFNFSTFGTISAGGAVVDRFGVGSNFDALTFPASPPTPQSITFTSLPPDPAVVGGTYQVTATGGGSGNPVTFSSLTPAVCTVSAGTVTFVALGTCTVAANQAGSPAFDAAPEVAQTFGVTTIAQLIMDFRALIPALGIEGGTANSLDAKLASALDALATGKTKNVCSALQAALNEIAAQSGKKLTTNQAATLNERANLIMGLLGC
jgi:hypothetical protein